MTKLFIAILAIFFIGLILYSPNIFRLYKLATLYNERSIAKNFINIDKLFETSIPIPAAESPYIFNKKDFDLPESYDFEGKTFNLLDGLAHFHTDGLIVLHDGHCLLYTSDAADDR